jgi:hypothetical protein
MIIQNFKDSKDKILVMMRFGFLVKILCSDKLFLTMPLPKNIKFIGKSTDDLDIDVLDLPKDFEMFFFISKDEQSFKQGNFYGVSLNDQSKVILDHYVSFTKENEYKLDDACCLCIENKTFGASEELIDSLTSLFEVRQ